MGGQASGGCWFRGCGRRSSAGFCHCVWLDVRGEDRFPSRIFFLLLIYSPLWIKFLWLRYNEVEVKQVRQNMGSFFFFLLL